MDLTMDHLNLAMFKAYDIRTKSDNLTPENEKHLIDSIVVYYKTCLKAESVVVARDTRLRAPHLQELLIEAFLSSGTEVYANLLQSSTCCFYHTCMQHLDSAGVMITASHNSSSYIGFKFVSKRCCPIAYNHGPEGGIAKIKNLYLSDRLPDLAKGAARGKLHIENQTSSFVDYSLKLAGVKNGDLEGLSIFFEFFSGAAATDVLVAFEKAGASCHASHMVPDGSFYYGDPNPIIESSTKPARELMAGGLFDLGFYFDGDGDRVDLMDSHGDQIAPGFNMAIIAPEILDIFRGFFSDFKPIFYIDVKAIPTAIREIARTGVGVEIIRNGHSFIKSKLEENFHRQVLASEEESAHYYMNFPVDPDDLSKGFVATENSLFFCLLAAKMLNRYPRKYEEAKKRQQSIFRFKEWPLHFNDPRMMEAIMEEVKTKMTAQGASFIDKMEDGSTLDAGFMRFNLPERIGKDTVFPPKWRQEAQRISRSEDAMARWEVVSNDAEICAKTNNQILQIAGRYAAQGLAHF